MSDKQLKEKAVNIKGKSYVLVSDRVVYFNETYPNGGITTSYVLEGDTYHFKAEVTPDFKIPERKFTGHSQATIGDGMVNKTAAMENSETSAVGRALAMMGIGVIESIASVDEIHKAQGSQGRESAPRRASMKQIQFLAQKVKWAFPKIDKEEIVTYLDNAIGKPLSSLLASDVDEAIKKVDAALRDDKLMDAIEPPTQVEDLNVKGINLTDEELKKVEDGSFLDDVNVY